MSTPPLYPYYIEVLEMMYGRPCQRRNPTPILSALINLAKSSTEFLDALSSKFAENHFSSIIQTFLTTKRHTPDLKCDLHSCIRYSTRNEITQNISLCEFIVKLGFLSNSCLEYSTLVLALEKLTYLSSYTRLLECSSSHRKPLLPVLLEELATPLPQSDSYAWKENLSNELLRDAHSKYDSIVNTVGFVCRDLEQRCLTVEAPLRKAQEEIKNLKGYIETITQEKISLEESCAALHQELGDVKNQKEILTHELRCSRAEVEGCQGQLMNAAAEKEGILTEIEKKRVGWMEREEELLMTNRVLDDELKEILGKVKELDEKVTSPIVLLISASPSREGKKSTVWRSQQSAREISHS